MADDPLDDFERATFTHEGATKAVFRKGVGPAVVVIAEAPGITPKVAEFARRLPDIGCTAVMPLLFGVLGRDTRMSVRDRARALVELVGFSARLCVSNEFVTFAAGRSSPVVTWLRGRSAPCTRNGGPWRPRSTNDGRPGRRRSGYVFHRWLRVGHGRR